MENPVYMDHNATTAVRPEARDAAATALRATGNPSSVHGWGRRARKIVEDAREDVAALVHADPSDVILTSGGTEANNLALGGTGRTRVLASAVEHVSVLDAVPGIEAVPVDGEGVIDLVVLDAMLAEGPDDRDALVSVMVANNETGVVQPVADAARIAHRHGALFHCDAAQAAGRMSLKMAALGADMVTLSAHKIGGIPGAGALVLAPGIEILPLIRGGGQERRRRAGTENVPGIAAFGAAARAAQAGIEEFRRLGQWRDRIEAALGEKGAVVFGRGADRVCNTTCLALPGADAESRVIQLDLAGVAVSAGAACSSGKVEASHVLAAMGAEDTAARRAIRISLGWNTTETDVAALLAVVSGFVDGTTGGMAAA